MQRPPDWATGSFEVWSAASCRVHGIDVTDYVLGVPPDELGPVEPGFEPLLISIGRAVLAAAALEKVLLVDIARRRADRDGLVDQLSEDVSKLERQPAGSLLTALKELGLTDELAQRTGELILRRNNLVHRFLEDPVIVSALESGNIDPVIEQVDRVAVDCQTVVNEIAPDAFGGVAQIFGMPVERVVDLVRAVDPASITDERLREQLVLIQSADAEELRAFLRGEG
jgi:hypothetical protein